MPAKAKPAKPAEPKNKGGRPRKEIDYAKLKKLCSLHCTGEECAALLEMQYEALNRALKRDGHGGFVEYFKKYSAGAKMSLRRKQFQKAIDEGNVPMLIWLGKQFLGQKDQIEEQQHIKPLEIKIIDATAPDND